MDDELDRRRARQYAWRIVDPRDVMAGEPEAAGRAPADATAGAAGDAGATGEQEGGDEGGDARSTIDDDWREKAAREAAILADGVDRVWAVTDAARQAEQVAALIQRADAMGLPLVAMQDHPLQSARLLRLVVRHRDRLTPETVEAASGSALWLDYSHPEISELILEVSIAGDRHIECALLMALGGERAKPPQAPGFAARLGRIIDEGPTWTSRLVALHFVDMAEGDAVMPALCRALRAPHLGVRWWALHHLNSRFPDAIREEDVLFLLEDAVIHPLPNDLRSEEIGRGVCYYPGELETAAARLRPRGGDVALARIIEGDCVHGNGLPRGALDGSWALLVLAAAYPARATPFIDAWLGSTETWMRTAAAEAASRLPAAEARPRLLHAAADGAPDVSATARERWLKLFGEPCPADELAGVQVKLLDGAPSERLRSRILALRGPIAAREAMAEVLLGEAPDAEALVALIFALGDSAVVHYPNRASLPKGRDTWCREILARFGERGADGLCALADRYPEGRVGWRWALDSLVGRKLIPESRYGAVREVAARRIAGTRDFDALSLLSRLGAPVETHARLQSIALDPDAESYERGEAARALAASSKDPALDAFIAAEMQAGLDGRDLPRVARAAAIGLARKEPQAIALARRALEEGAWAPPEDPEVIEALGACASALRRAEALPDGWDLAALSQPETCAFTIAAEQCNREAPPEARRALRKALSSRARGGAAAAEAAEALLHLREVSPRNRRLPAICQAAPLVARGKLFAELLHLEAPLTQMWPALEELLTSEDPRATSLLQNHTYALSSRRGLLEPLRQVLPRVVDEELRASLECLLELPAEVETYWQDGPEDEDEDEDE